MTKETVEKYVQAIDGKSILATVKGGEKNENGAISMPWVDYDDVINDLMKDFFESDMVDYDYHRNSNRLLDGRECDAARIATMTRAELGTYLTYILRGERFCTGIIKSFLDNGVLVALLQRLSEML